MYTDVICNPFWLLFLEISWCRTFGNCNRCLYIFPPRNTLNLNFDSTDVNLILVTIIYHFGRVFHLSYIWTFHRISPSLPFFSLGCFIPHPSPKPRKMSPVKNNYTLRIQICREKGISPVILLWGWDWDHQTYSREGYGSLGISQLPPESGWVIPVGGSWRLMRGGIYRWTICIERKCCLEDPMVSDTPISAKIFEGS